MRRTSPTTPEAPPGARFRRRPAFTPPSCSSPTTAACTSSPPGTPARWSTRPPRRSRPELMVERHAIRCESSPTAGSTCPPEEPYMEGHNTWCVNVPGSLLVIPVADIAQHCSRSSASSPRTATRSTTTSTTGDPRAGAVRRIWSTSRSPSAHVRRAVRAHRGHRGAGDGCYAGVADAAGDGAGRLDVRRDRPLLDAGRLRQPGGARPRLPLRRGRALVDAQPHRPDGVFEAFCPPHHADMAAAVEAFAERKFGRAARSTASTPGAWSDSPGVRGSAQVHDAEFKACVALQASTSSTPSASSRARCRRSSS